MSDLEAAHDEHGATFLELGGQRMVAEYGRPDRTHLAIRNGAGIIERPLDIVVVTGDDRIEYVDNAVTNAVPNDPGSGCFALLLTPKGRIRTELYVHVAEDRLFLLLPPGTARDLLEDWREKVFIQDVTFQLATEDYVVFGVHGPKATEKLASVVGDVAIPETPFSLTQATMADAGVTILPTDNPCGEEGYDVVCGAYDAPVVFETLLTRGYNAVPFGWRTWETLTLEAGSLLFSDVVEKIPNVVGLRSALDFEKGCYVGQEVVSRLENLGESNDRVVGLTLGRVPETGATVRADGDEVGTILRGDRSPTLEEPIALALLDTGAPAELSVERDGDTIDASRTSIPFVEGSRTSGRLPRYPDS